MGRNKVTACLLGSCDSWDMLRPIGRAGIPCALFAEPNDHVKYSRYAKFVFDRANATEESDILLRQLREFSRTQREKPILYYATDADLLFVSRYRDRLSDYLRFVIADADHVEILQNKEGFHSLSTDLNLPVPQTQPVAPSSQSASSITLPFPIILKPAEREIPLEPGTESIRARVGDNIKCIGVSDPSELDRIWPELAAINVDFIAQEMIPGPESRIESYHAYVDARGNNVASFTGRKIRTYRAEFGYSTALETTDAKDLDRLGAEIVGLLGVTGVLKLDFKRRPDNSLALLEVNPRFSLWQHLGAMAGVDMLSLVYKDLTNQPRGQIGKARPGVIYCRMRDVRAAREQGMPLLQWIRWMLRADAKEIALDDPLPLLMHVKMKLAQSIRPDTAWITSAKKTT